MSFFNNRISLGRCKPVHFAAALVVALFFSLTASSAHSQTIFGDSLTDWDPTGTQGTNDFSYGWRNFTLDGGAAYNHTTDFIPFLNDGSNVVSQNGPNQWSGTDWNMANSAAPWTNLGPEFTHPNGTNNAQEHWTIRRYTVPVGLPSDLALTNHMRAQNFNGTGTTSNLYLNGTLLDTFTTNSAAGISNKIFVNGVSAGDIIDLALTPVGAGGDTADGADGSFNRLTITDEMAPPPPPPPIIPIADSSDEWTTTGVHENPGWENGYSDRGAGSAVGEIYNSATDFTPYPGAWWTGSAFDAETGAAQPWTFQAQQDVHPNGSNQPNTHWNVRRWNATVTEPTPTEIVWHTRKVNPNGTGVTGILIVNGTEVDRETLAANDTTGVTRSWFANINPGDKVELLLTPEGTDGSDADGSDGSANRLTINPLTGSGPFFNVIGQTGGDKIADSQADWSPNGTQGANNWFYGFYDQRDDVENGDGVYGLADMDFYLNDGSTVISTDPAQDGWKASPNHWDGTKWDLLSNGAPVSTGPWTETSQAGGHPAANGQESNDVHWAVRRWVNLSAGAGTFTIEGVLNNPSAGGDGVIGRIFVDGVEVWSALSDGTNIPYSVDVTLNANSIVDFAIDPDGAGVLDVNNPATLDNIQDGADGTTFTGMIITPVTILTEEFIPIPEPSSIALALLSIVGMLVWRRKVVCKVA